MVDEPLPWWVELADDTPRLRVSKCPTCREDVDSVDAFCPTDSTSLLGHLASERTLLKVAYLLRAIAVAAAVAVGYLGWAWPAYLAGVIFVLVFALLFVRNHKASFMYLAVAVACVAAGHWIWEVTGAAAFGSLVIGLLLIALFGELLFATGITLRTAADGSFDVSPQTLITTSIGLAIAVAATTAVTVASITHDIVPPLLSWLAIHAAPLAASATVIAILVSSIAYTIRGPVFSIPDIFRPRDILFVVKFGRIPIPMAPSRHTALELFASTMERVAVVFANGVTTAVEAAYNVQVRGLVNGVARGIVSLANSCYLVLAKLARHVARTLRRFGVVARSCGSYFLAVARRFWAAFGAPVLLAWIACAELWWIAEEFRAYVAHQNAWFTPMLSLVRIGVATAALSSAAIWLLQIRVSEFGKKFVSAASAIGGNAFLFFVVIAWTLGTVGWLTNGPYRVGWVTLASTGVIVSVLITLRARRGVNPTS